MQDAEKPKPAASAVAPKPIKRKRHIPWYKIALGTWALIWLGWGATVSYRDSKLIMIPEDLSPEVSLPTVNEKALDEIRSRDAAGLIVPSQNNSPRANPFE